MTAMHIQEEQYLWDKMIEAERAKARSYVHDLAMQAIVDLRLYGIDRLWMAEQFWMNDLMVKIMRSQTAFIDYHDSEGTKDDGPATLR